MQADKSNSTYRMNIGGASIILILLVFSMTIFAVLSIRASYHELKLARNSRSYINNYYAADTQAEIIYASVCESAAKGLSSDELLREVKASLKGHADETAVGSISIGNSAGSENAYILSYETAVNENAEISVELDILEDNVTINKWKMQVEALTGYGNDAFEIWESDWFE